MYTQKTVSNFYNNGCNFFQARNLNIVGFNSLNPNSIFTNCFGEYNYNAIMGVSVITSLIKTGAMYFSSKSEEKAEAKSELDDKKAKVAEIDNKIEELASDKKNNNDNEIQKLKAEKERLEQEIEQANFYSYCNKKKLKKEDYDKLFTNNSTELSNNHEPITSGAIRTATTKFITSTGEDKQQAANEFMALWAEYRYQDNIPTIELEMYNTISRYLDNNSEQ